MQDRDLELQALRAFMSFRRGRTSEFEEFERLDNNITVARLGNVVVVKNDEDVYIFAVRSAERATKLVELVKKLYSVFNSVLLHSLADNVVEEREVDILWDDEHEYTFIYEG